MPAPESTPALEAFRLRLISDLNEAFEEFVSALDPDFIASLGSAGAKLAAPVGASHTSAMAWRGHLQTLRAELKQHFGENEFRLKELCSFLDSRVDLLPGDIKTYVNKNRQVIVWHQTVHGAISCRAHVWGGCGAVISYTGTRDRWRVV